MSHQNDTNIKRIGIQACVIMWNYIRKGPIQNNVEPSPADEKLKESETSLEPSSLNVDGIVHALKMIADELDGDQRVQRLIAGVPAAASQQAVLAVVNGFFERGISWGNIAILFYFCYKMALRALNQPLVIRNIISWVADFIVDRLARWILERGGWEGIVRYARTLSRWAIGIFIGGFVAAGAVVAYHVWGR